MPAAPASPLRSTHNPGAFLTALTDGDQYTRPGNCLRALLSRTGASRSGSESALAAALTLDARPSSSLHGNPSSRLPVGSDPTRHLGPQRPVIGAWTPPGAPDPSRTRPSPSSTSTSSDVITPERLRDALGSLNPDLLVTFSLDDLSSLIHALASALSLDPARAILMAAARPACLDVQDTQSRCRAVASALQVPISHAAAAVASQPELLSMPPEALASCTRRMAALMAVDASSVCRMLGRTGSSSLQTILDLPSSVIQQQVIDVQAVLDSRLSTYHSPKAASLVICNPDLLTASTVSMTSSLDKAMDIIRVHPRRMARLLLKCPKLLTMSPMQLTAQFRGMVAALRVNPSAMVRMLGMEPRLLKQHMLSLKATLRISIDLVLEVMVQQPNLLCFSPATLEDKLQHLSELLCLPLVRTIELALRQTSLLTMSRQRMGETTEGLRRVLGADARQLAKVVQQAPALLLQKPARVAERVADVALLLALSDAAAVKMALRKPEFLLGSDLRLWQSNIDTLTSQLGLSIQSARALVLHSPAILASEPKQFYARCAQLRRLICNRPAWAKSLEDSTPALLRSVLYYGPAHLQRLQYLADTGLAEDRSPFRSGEIFNRRSFVALYPGFEDWAKGVQRAQGRTPRGAEYATVSSQDGEGGDGWQSNWRRAQEERALSEESEDAWRVVFGSSRREGQLVDEGQVVVDSWEDRRRGMQASSSSARLSPEVSVPSTDISQSQYQRKQQQRQRQQRNLQTPQQQAALRQLRPGGSEAVAGGDGALNQGGSWTPPEAGSRDTVVVGYRGRGSRADRDETALDAG